MALARPPGAGRLADGRASGVPSRAGRRPSVPPPVPRGGPHQRGGLHPLLPGRCLKPRACFLRTCMGELSEYARGGQAAGARGGKRGRHLRPGPLGRALHPGRRGHRRPGHLRGRRAPAPAGPSGRHARPRRAGLPQARRQARRPGQPVRRSGAWLLPVRGARPVRSCPSPTRSSRRCEPPPPRTGRPAGPCRGSARDCARRSHSGCCRMATRRPCRLP